MLDLIGQQLGQYKIMSVLGEGGMAVVYRARQLSIERDVAIKITKPGISAIADVMTRFKREAQVMALLSHPHIRKIFDYGQQDEIVYLVSEFIDGETLADMMSRGRLPLRTIGAIVFQIASALDYAHSRGITHRDLKPDNMLIDSGNNIFLTDFGLAKLNDDKANITLPAIILGTPTYMAPEQWEGVQIDGRADNYALAIIIFEMLTGRPPFVGSNHYAVMRQHLFDPPPYIRNVREDLPETLDSFFIEALAKVPDQRFSSAMLMAEVLKSLIDDRATPTPLDMAIHEKHERQPTPHYPERTQVLDHSTPYLDSTSRTRVTPVTRMFINTLPQDVSDRYIGREKQQADILNLIAARTRLISIYGRSGIGKTALVCKLLSDLQNGLGESYRAVYLSSTNTGISLERIVSDFSKLFDPETNQALTALAYNKQLEPAQKVSALMEQIEKGQYILLLDNLDAMQDPNTGKLTDPALETFFDVAMSHGGSLRIIVTSREPLSLPRRLKTWERLILLEDGLTTAEATTLLRRFDPDGVAGLRDAEESKLHILAEKTHGYPRALEAVAGLLLEDPLMSVETLITDSATFDSEIIPILVQQAIGRLPPDALRIMEVLALLEQAVPQDAIEYLLMPYIEMSSLHTTLSRLVKGYFVAFNKESQLFSLHPMDRDYCYSRLPEGSIDDKLMTPSPYTRQMLHYRAAAYYHSTRQAEQKIRSIEDLAPHMSEVDHLMSAGDYDAATQVLLQYGDAYLHLQ